VRRVVEPSPKVTSDYRKTEVEIFNNIHKPNTKIVRDYLLESIDEDSFGGIPSLDRVYLRQLVLDVRQISGDEERNITIESTDKVKELVNYYEGLGYWYDVLETISTGVNIYSEKELAEKRALCYEKLGLLYSAKQFRDYSSTLAYETKLGGLFDFMG
jgi:hypothetical protein